MAADNLSSEAHASKLVQSDVEDSVCTPFVEFLRFLKYFHGVNNTSISSLVPPLKASSLGSSALLRRVDNLVNVILHHALETLKACSGDVHHLLISKSRDPAKYPMNMTLDPTQKKYIAIWKSLIFFLVQVTRHNSSDLNVDASSADSFTS